MTPREAGAAPSDVRSKLGAAWRSIGSRSAGAAHRLEALQLDPLSIGNQPLLAALDGEGRRHLLVPLLHGAADVEDSRSAGVILSTRTLDRPGGHQRYADLACMRTDLTGVFAGLAADVCATVIGATEPGLLVAQKLSAWRELFETPPLVWSSGRLAGLFAELLVLRTLLDADGSAASAWSGPLGEAQDFRRGRHAIEIKATLSPETRMVSVHGWDQLEPPTDGTLRLGWFRLRLSDGGNTVPELIADCLGRAGVPGDVQTRLDRLGLPELDSKELHLRLQLAEERWFEVDAAFPAVVPARFAAGHIPTGVVSLEYRIDLDTVRPSPTDRAAAIARLLDLS